MDNKIIISGDLGSTKYYRGFIYTGSESDDNKCIKTSDLSEISDDTYPYPDTSTITWTTTSSDMTLALGTKTYYVKGRLNKGEVISTSSGWSITTTYEYDSDFGIAYKYYKISKSLTYNNGLNPLPIFLKVNISYSLLGKGTSRDTITIWSKA